jgi:hypothetical protein
MSFRRRIALLLVLLTGVPWVMASSKESAARPRFSWDTVPQWLIVRKATAFTEEESRLIAAAPLVVFEKANGYKDAGSVEDGILRAARAVKAVDSKTVTLFYWNAVINYSNYRANDAFDQNRDAWALKKHGKPFLFKDRYPIYDLLDRGLQDWWIATAKAMVSDPAIDGIMIDAICKTGGLDDGRRAIYPSPEYGRAYFATATRLKAELGNALVVGNALRVSEPQFNMQHLKYLDGSYVERWGVPMGGRTYADYVADGMMAMSQALANGTLILFNSSPEALGRDAHPAQDADYAAREAWMKQHITFPLAVFLMIAEEGAFFHWGTGPDALPGPRMDVWRNDIYDELSRPLGKPLGPASARGNTYTRHFQHLDVSLDLERREATFDWH